MGNEALSPHVQVKLAILTIPSIDSNQLWSLDFVLIFNSQSHHPIIV